jgi:carbon-monoxide dehydrogenase medium subunit
VKPAHFDYARPDDLEGVLALLETPEAKLLAGGQSLIPLLNLRLARPSLLIDIGRLPGLDGVAVAADGSLRLGALVRHQRLLTDLEVGARVPLLRHAVRHVGHVATRNRGTLGGSLAHADPTAELAAAAVALDARIRLVSRRGERLVPARDFFEGAFTTAAGENEMVAEVVIPPRPAGEGSAFLELSPREGDFAIVAVAALARRQGDTLTGVVLAWSGAGPAAILAAGLMSSLEGVSLAGDEVERRCAAAVGWLQPAADIRGTPEYKRAALGVLTARAVREAAA